MGNRVHFKSLELPDVTADNLKRSLASRAYKNFNVESHIIFVKDVYKRKSSLRYCQRGIGIMYFKG